jgi:hypothetical protein
VFVIAKKFFTPSFGQPLLLTKIIKPKIPDQDTARSFVILLATKRPRQVEVRKSYCPSGMPTFSFDESKAAKPVVDVKPILDFEFSPMALWNFDGACLSRKVTGLSAEFSIELWQHPKEPIQISHNNLWKGFAPISAKPHHAPRHFLSFR